MTAEAVAEETSSPEVTDGASSSGAAAEEPKTLADIIADDAEKASKEFKEEHGSADEETGEAPDETVEETAPKAEQKSDTTHDKDDGDEEARLSDDEFKALPDGARKRIGYLSARAKKAERQLGELNTELEGARKDQEALGQLRQFAAENQLSQQDVAVALGAMAKFRTGDFKGFVADLQPMIETARQSVGEAVAPDLQQQVDDGYLTEEAAREMTRMRLEAQRNREAAERANAEVSAERQRSQAQTATSNIVKAVNAREAELRSSDPDYAKKAAAVKRLMDYALKNGARPRTPEDAVAMVNEAYAQATEMMPKPAPKPTPTQHVPASTSSRGSPRPATLEDALAMSPPPGAVA